MQGIKPGKPHYAVFILRNGAWKLHCDYGAGISNAKEESRYLNESLGVTAKVFFKRD